MPDNWKLGLSAAYWEAWLKKYSLMAEISLQGLVEHSADDCVPTNPPPGTFQPLCFNWPQHASFLADDLNSQILDEVGF